MAELKRVRSPNYPAIGLPEAMDAARKLQSKIGRNPAAREALAKVMGFGGLNGASTVAISALVKYGLLEKSGEDLKLSERAMKLIAAQSVEEHTEALWEAARAPVLFAELVEQYKGKLPDDEVIRSYLKRKGFADSALPQVIQSFRETMELVTRDGNAYSPDIKSSGGDGMQGNAAQQDQLKTMPTKLALGERELVTGLLSKSASFRLLVSGEVGVKEIERLISKLELDKAILADPDADDPTE